MDLSGRNTVTYVNIVSPNVRIESMKGPGNSYADSKAPKSAFEPEGLGLIEPIMSVFTPVFFPIPNKGE